MISVKCTSARWIARLVIAALLSTNLLQSAPSSETAAVSTISAIGSRTQLHSSVLLAVAFSESKKILELEFRSGSIFQYLDVPPSVYQDLLNAESKGRFYNRRIKKHYKSQKVKAP